MKNILILGGGGFIGSCLGKKLKSIGNFVRIADIKNPEFLLESEICDEFMLGDLTNFDFADKVMDLNGELFDEVYQLAADMGGAGYIFTGENDANVMHNSALINLNICHLMVKYKHKKVFYSSSACMYPEYNQLDPNNPKCSEESAYPAAPDSEYGWEKLFSERLYLAYHRNYKLDVRIARYHNIYGPCGTWNNGKEKAPAAICRKVIMAENDGEIEIWGDGTQTRSFLYIDECLEAMERLMNSHFIGPVNIGSDEMVTINELVDVACSIEGKKLKKKHIKGPLGVRGRNSDNTLIKEKLNWSPNYPLKNGIEKTYNWIKTQIKKTL
jgi:GDP-D-mannose 3',5'-epimerase